MKYDAILFDWVGVLLKQKNPINNSINSKIVNDYICTNWKKPTSKNELIKSLKVDDIQFEQIMLNYINENFEAYIPLWEILPSLSSKYKLAVINNGPQLTIPYFTKIFNFDKYGLFVNSESIGIWKPNPEIFKYTLNEINIKKERALYMDDAEFTEALFETTGIYSFQWKNHEDGMQKFNKILKEND